MEFASNKSTENHLLKGSFRQQGDRESFNLGFLDQKTSDLGSSRFSSETSCNSLISEPFERDLAFENFDSLRMNLSKDSLISFSQSHLTKFEGRFSPLETFSNKD